MVRSGADGVARHRCDPRSGRARSRADPAAAPAGDEALVEIIIDGGVDVVVEQGILRGEVLGLEVARIVDGKLEVGVGKFEPLRQRR